MPLLPWLSLISIFSLLFYLPGIYSAALSLPISSNDLPTQKRDLRPTHPPPCQPNFDTWFEDGTDYGWGNAYGGVTDACPARTPIRVDFDHAPFHFNWTFYIQMPGCWVKQYLFEPMHTCPGAWYEVALTYWPPNTPIKTRKTHFKVFIDEKMPIIDLGPRFERPGQQHVERAWFKAKKTATPLEMLFETGDPVTQEVPVDIRVDGISVNLVNQHHG